MYICCPCGERIHDNTDRQAHKGRIISDKEYFDFLDFADEMIESSHENREELIMTFRRGMAEYISLRTVYQCYSCGRIAICGSDGEPQFFLPEGHNDCRMLDFEAGEKPEIVYRKK